MKKDSKRKGDVWKRKGGPMVVGKDDSRYEAYREHWKRTGISPDETWNLYFTFALIALPRLKLFREQTICCPADLGTMDRWHEVLDKMIHAFELIADDEHPYSEKENGLQEVEEGLDLFRKYYLALWW